MCRLDIILRKLISDLNMKTNLFKTALACALSIAITSTHTSAQTYGKGIVGLGNHNTDIDHIGYFGETEVFTLTVPNSFGGLTYRMYSYKDKKKIAQAERVVEFNGKKYVPEGFVMKPNKLLAFFIASDASETTTSLYMQEFSEELKAVGSAKKIEDLPYAMDGGKFKQSYGTPLFVKEPVKHQNLEYLHNVETGAIILTFSLKYDGSKAQVSYAKSIVLDDNLNKVLVKDYKSKSPSKIIKTNLQKIYSNNDAFFTIQEGEIEKVKGSEKFMISRHAMVFISGDGSEMIELELESDFEHIRGVVTSEEISNEGLYYYAIQSNKVEADYGHTSIYSFNPKNEQTKQVSVQMGTGLKLPKPSKMEDFRVNKMFVLSDNSLIIEYYGMYSGNIVMKTSMSGEVDWTTINRGPITGSLFACGILSCVTEDKHISVFNVHPGVLKGNTISMEKAGGVDLGSSPCVSTIDLSTGKTTFSLMDGKGNTLGAINFIGSRSKANGEFQLRMKFNGKVQTVPVSFN